MKISKTLFLITLFVSLASFTSGDKIKFKDGAVFINDSKCMTYKRLNAVTIKFITLDSSNSIILKNITYKSYGVEKRYSKIVFTNHDKSLTSMSYIFTKKLLIKNLLKSEVIKGCTFHENKIDEFIQTHHESIEETIIRD